MSIHVQLADHVAEVLACRQCSGMIGPVVTSRPSVGKVYLVGQAPGPHEGKFGQPFAWTAGKTLFNWFGTIGVDEETFRSGVFMAAVCRCFPGKASGGGDRVPDRNEIKACSGWMHREIQLLKPDLILPVGRLAIEQFLEPSPLADIIGKAHRARAFDHECDLIPLPHPSGASTWFKVEPGITLLKKALKLIGAHPAWKQVRN